LCLQETIDASLTAAFEVFGQYLAHEYVHTCVSIARNQVTDAAELTALVLPAQASTDIANVQLEVLDQLIQKHRVRKAFLVALIFLRRWRIHTWKTTI
jgi:hypothetical protein